MQEKLQDPVYRAQYEERQAAFQIEYERLLANPETRLQTIFIPVAVHFPEANESNRGCLEDLARDQIRILNEDFSATNGDISNWTAASSNYPGVNLGSIDVQFVLATTNHPTGIDPDLIEGEPAVTIGENILDTDSRFSGYQNFIVKPIAYLGYSPLGGQPSNGNSVVMNTNAFGSTGAGCPGFIPGAPYNLGRTVTHELGHFYNLYHTFDGCGAGDLVADTPALASSTGGCPSPGSVSSCLPTESALTMNYMDYTNDACICLLKVKEHE